MHQRMGVLVVVLMVATGGVAGFMGAAAGATGGSQEGSAQVTFTEQTSGGQTVVVDSVTMAEGGFVAIHDASLNEGETLASVVGSSTYLEAGTHHNVTVHLDEPLSEDATLVAMPHKDTNGDHAYEFVSSQGETDGPYTEGEDIVLESANVTVSATVSMSDQPTGGQFVTVDRTELSEGGFVTIHDSSLLDGATFDSVRGTSGYLGAGVHENVRVRLDDQLDNEDTLIPMAHKDTNDNQQYDFVSSEGGEDGPYLNDEDEAVIDTARVTPTDEASVNMSNTSSSGHYVSVDEAFLPDGGFVTVHDSTVLDGAVFDSIRGSSDYLEPGLHRNVGVHLNETLEEDDTLVPMAHKDTNDNEAYDFAETEGDEDGPYTTDDGDPVVDTAEVVVSADVTIDRQESNGNTVVVDHVDLSEPGFVTVHDASLGAGATLDSVRGSTYLEAGHHHDVEVTLDEPLTESQDIVAMPHKDTNGNEAYDFVDTEGGEDGPFTANGDIVVDSARASVNAQVTYEEQSTAGETVTVQSVTVHDGGFVTIHDSSLLDGATFDSVRGTSDYLAPGTHENVEVTLDEPLSEDDTLIAMPHRDTNDNEAYDFVSSEGANDAPYVAAGDIVLAPAETTVEQAAEASVSISDQSSDGSTVTVDSAELSEGGFVTIHDGSLLDDATFDSVRGSSAYLEAGSHSDIEITLDDPYTEDGTAIAMPHLDTNGNEAYDFVSSDGDEDGPYTTTGGDIVLDDASLTVEDDMGNATPTDMQTDTPTDMQTDTPTDMQTDGSSGNGPGFGVVAALLAVVAAALVARRN